MIMPSCPLLLFARKGNAVLEGLRKMQPLVAAGEPDCKMYQVCRAKENPDYLMLYGTGSLTCCTAGAS